MRIRQVDKHMQTSLRGIAIRAQNDPNHRFGNLYGLLNEQNLCYCFKEMNKKAASGVDNVDYVTYEQNLEENVSDLVTRLKKKTYKASLVKRTYIPKDQYKKRALGIPVVEDKLVQKGAAEILSAIFEPNFKDFSHGYRRGKGPQKAAMTLRKDLAKGRFGWVVDADIKGFFDNLDHDQLIKMLETKISDTQFINLIRKWLKAGILDVDGEVINPITGTPQGGVISAVLANIYLHFVLDQWFDEVVKPKMSGAAMIIRFADDFVVCFQYIADAKKFYKVLDKRLNKFNLSLAEDKTKLIKFTRFKLEDESEIFKFLGFEYRWCLSRDKNVGKSKNKKKPQARKPYVRVRTDRKKLRKAITNMTSWLKEVYCRNRVAQTMKKLREKIQGHFNYYGVAGNYDSIKMFHREVQDLVFKWLNRRSQKKSYTKEGFIEMWEYHKIPDPKVRVIEV